MILTTFDFKAVAHFFYVPEHEKRVMALKLYKGQAFLLRCGNSTLFIEKCDRGLFVTWTGGNFVADIKEIATQIKKVCVSLKQHRIEFVPFSERIEKIFYKRIGARKCKKTNHYYVKV